MTDGADVPPAHRLRREPDAMESGFMAFERTPVSRWAMEPAVAAALREVRGRDDERVSRPYRLVQASRLSVRPRCRWP